MLPERGEGCCCKGKTPKTVYLANIYFIYINSVVGAAAKAKAQKLLSKVICEEITCKTMLVRSHHLASGGVISRTCNFGVISRTFLKRVNF